MHCHLNVKILSKVVTKVRRSAVRCLFFFIIIKEPEFSRQVVVKITNIKSPVNPSCGSGCVRSVHAGGHADLTQPIVFFFCANALRKKVH